MNKRKYFLDWYEEHTPSNEEEYERGCLTVAIIIATLFGIFTVLFIVLTKEV